MGVDGEMCGKLVQDNGENHPENEICRVGRRVIKTVKNVAGQSGYTLGREKKIKISDNFDRKRGDGERWKSAKCSRFSGQCSRCVAGEVATPKIQ